LLSKKGKGHAPTRWKASWVGKSLDTAYTLQRMDLKISAAAGSYDVKEWPQRLLYEFPEILSIKQIDDGFGQLISLCRELPYRSVQAGQAILII